MLKFIYGTNSYLLRERKRGIEAEFLKVDPSGLNLDRLEGADLILAKFVQAVSAMPFLAPKRLVIIENLLLENKDSDLKNKIVEIIEQSVLEDLELVFVEAGEPDKRSRLYKLLVKKAQVLEARPLEGRELVGFALEEFEAERIKVSEAVARQLVESSGNDMQNLVQEVAKLSLYVRSQGRDTLQSADVGALVVSELDPNVFAFTEALVRKDAKLSAKLLNDLLANGESEQKLTGTIAYQFRTLIIIKDCLERRMTPGEISRECKLAPFIVNKNISMARSRSLRSLVGMYESLRRTDAITKSSAIPADLAMNIFVATLCK